MWAASVDSFEALPAWSVANVRVTGLETSILSHVRAAQMALHLPLQCLRMKEVLKAMVGEKGIRATAFQVNPANSEVEILLDLFQKSVLGFVVAALAATSAVKGNSKLHISMIRDLAKRRLFQVKT